MPSQDKTKQILDVEVDADFNNTLEKTVEAVKRLKKCRIEKSEV